MPALDPITLKLLAPLPLLAASLYFFARGREKPALGLLLAAAAALRLVMITLDPYLHPWDERFHALVAKNLMTNPLRPVLRADAVLPYDPAAWCCNHVWLHKPPLFLWQMAASMKLFGVNLLALRLPGALLGTLAVYCVFRIARIWTRDFSTAYLAALLAAGSYFQLELTAGRLSLDHADVAFTAYVTASLWAFCEYTLRPRWRWALLTGLLAGAAVLVKWLPGMLVFAGWALYAAEHPGLRVYRRAVPQFAAALALCLAVFLPWQWYVQRAFPLENAAVQTYNWQSVADTGPDPNPAFHLFQFDALYHGAFLPFFALGAYLVARRRERALSAALFGILVLLYAFYTFVATKTKAPSFTFPASVLVFSLIALGLVRAGAWLRAYVAPRAWPAVAAIGLGATAFCALKPDEIVAFRQPGNFRREAAMHNTALYQNLHRAVPPEHIILNTKEFEDVEIMFWQPHNAFYWFPNRREIQRLQAKGHTLAAFAENSDNELPEYLLEDSSVLKLRLPLR